MTLLVWSPEAVAEITDAPEEVRKSARKATVLFAQNQRHPSLMFKKVGKLWSIRLAYGWRILMRELPDGYEAVHVRNHDDYERLIRTWH